MYSHLFSPKIDLPSLTCVSHSRGMKEPPASNPWSDSQVKPWLSKLIIVHFMTLKQSWVDFSYRVHEGPVETISFVLGWDFFLNLCLDV